MNSSHIEGNPVPPGCIVEAITTRDGLRLRTMRWAPTTRARKGTVALFPGRAEFLEKYFETAAELLDRGFCVAALDWRGQGGSQRLLADSRKGHVRRFSDYQSDIEAFFRIVVAQHCPQPWFGLAHSMGGAILIDAAHGARVPIERLVCSAPMLGIHGVSPLRTRILAQILCLLGLGQRYIPGGGSTSIMTKPFAGNPLTSDPGRHERNGRIAASRPELAIGDPTIGWVRAAFGAMRRLADPQFAATLRLPLLIVAAGQDEVVSTPAIETFAAASRVASAIVLPGARHEILQESDAIRAAFWAAFDAFVPGS
jgi:lysophospholipase